ncbi:MAG: NADH-quinone oxidoreductase subunit H [Candidatus Eremiobacteraeota bacterium]|nr:NADH-quinone oxidoreductase subunit H [Candidatus Eremiobacteraeota bacterium]
MTLLQVLAILVFAPLVQGVLASMRAWLSGRPGPPFLQPYRDLAKLLRKEPRAGRVGSLVGFVAAGFALGTAVTILMMLPHILDDSVRTTALDVVALVLLFALGRAAVVIAALDTDSSFSAMAVGREIAFAAIVEAPFLLALLAARSTPSSALLAGSALFIVLLFESARVPVDNQETHYELTMIHEGMLLEYAGPVFAAWQYGAQLRQVAMLVLVAFVLAGSGLPMTLCFVAAVMAIPFVEAFQAKMRLFDVPQLATAATLLALAALGIDIIGGVR